MAIRVQPSSFRPLKIATPMLSGSPSSPVSSFDWSDAIALMYSWGRSARIVSSAAMPCFAKSAASASKNASLSLERAPFGLPAGLPDWPGFHGGMRFGCLFGVSSPLIVASHFQLRNAVGCFRLSPSEIVAVVRRTELRNEHTECLGNQLLSQAA